MQFLEFKILKFLNNKSILNCHNNDNQYYLGDPELASSHQRTLMPTCAPTLSMLLRPSRTTKSQLRKPQIWEMSSPMEDMTESSNWKSKTRNWKFCWLSVDGLLDLNLSGPSPPTHSEWTVSFMMQLSFCGNTTLMVLTSIGNILRVLMTKLPSHPMERALPHCHLNFLIEKLVLFETLFVKTLHPSHIIVGSNRRPANTDVRK